MNKLSFDKSNIEWLLTLGYVYIQTHKFSKALTVLKLVLVMRKNHPEALKLMSFAYFESGQCDRAFSSIKRWLQLPGSSRGEASVMFLLQARVLLRLKRKDLAKKCLMKHVALIAEEERVLEHNRKNRALTRTEGAAQ